jgi:hypothetical protein
MDIWLATGKKELLIVLGMSEALKLAKDYRVSKIDKYRAIDIIFDDYFEDDKKRIHNR